MSRPAKEGGGVDGLDGFLSVLQLSDSAFPSGRYTLSHGLEAMTQGGLLSAPADPVTLLDLLDSQVRYGVAPSDGVALACAHRATPVGSPDLKTILEADARLTAVKLGREARDASTRTGRALLSVARPAFGGKTLAEFAERVDSGRTPGNHAVVLGVLSAELGVPRLQAVGGELFAFAAGWVSAAVRLSVTDHRTAQGLLHRVRPALAEAAADAADRDVAHISACTPLLDVMSMRHEETGLRLFAS
jgi:urease accessory protein